MEQNIKLMAHYNLWANTHFYELFKSLDEAILDQEVKSSFSTLRKTFGHIYDAEKVWLNRLGGTDLKNFPSTNLERFEIQLLIAESKACVVYVESLNEQEMNSLCTFQSRGIDTISRPVWHILTHIFNHSTYHRGQLVTMLRELGVTEIPATDVIYYLRDLRD
jgi:uncharacterized damage-inducible protein DinB